MNNMHFGPGFSSTSIVPQATPVAEIMKAKTIRNDVNLKKATLRLEKDEQNPGFHLVAFSFDATVAGSIGIFFLAREGEGCGLRQLRPDLYRAIRVPFEEGLGQNFRQSPGCGVNLALFDENDLLRSGEDRVYTLVVRAETKPKNPPSSFSWESKPLVGAPLPPWMACQTTKAVVHRKDDGDVNVLVVGQNIWVEGTIYELQEIYGVDNTEVGVLGNESGKECVICMSERRDTTVLPCRHLCMCAKCAKVLRFQNNRCPICQAPMERLLEMSY